MGVDYHCFQFLRFAARLKQFGDIATIGRQAVYIPEFMIREHCDLPPGYRQETFCEGLLKACFGGRDIESIDNSDYEGASRILDLNKPIPGASPRYDTVIDFGTLEHIYNIAQAFENIAKLTRAGGQILHVLPANNFCGHGFWQISPELFFSLYSEANGYAETEVFLADTSRYDCWFEVIKPHDGRRVMVVTPSPVYVLCRTLKIRETSHVSVQQSDYVYLWEKSAAPAVASRDGYAVRAKYKVKMSSLGRLAVALTRILLYSQRRKQGLSSANPHLIKRPISELA